ncbi:MAG: trypsin-like peptidase domain-containing protein [Anaerolineales bacterium]
MKKQFFSLTGVLLVAVMLLSACSGITSAFSNSTSQVNAAQAASQTTTANPSIGGSNSSSNIASISSANTTMQAQIIANSDLLAAYESTLESIYTTVSPQVVNISVLIPATTGNVQTFPGFNNQQSQPQYSSALGSGFIWDTKGDIVTNNHVVDGATKIEVTFSDGTTVPATIVGQDPYSDLAVIKVDESANMLQPVTMADSTQVKVGEIAIAIGNPYGFEGSMTVGTVSGIGRELPTDTTSQSTGATYSIPDVIQTDAAINPGNSGGVLVNDQGQVIGVTSALESSSGSSSGIGFAIPAEIVSQVVPSLISTGKYDHPYLGISGTDMTPDIAQAMNLPSDTRGALIETVVAGGPAADAGLQGSNTVVTINGVQGTVGGDIITAIDGQTINSMSDIIAYLAIHTQVGQTVTMTILRNGKTQSVQVTLATRPAQ